MAYREAADILDQLLKKKDGLKSLVYGSKDLKDKRSNTPRAYALVCETLKYKSGAAILAFPTCFRLQSVIAWSYDVQLSTKYWP